MTTAEAAPSVAEGHGEGDFRHSNGEFAMVSYDLHAKVVRERDAHRAHRTRLEQEKKTLLDDFKREREKFERYEPTLIELRQRLTSAGRKLDDCKRERDALRERIAAIDKPGRGNGQEDRPGREKPTPRAPRVKATARCEITAIRASAMDASVALCTIENGWELVDFGVGAIARADSLELCTHAAFAGESRIAAANYHGSVVIWNLNQRESVAEFQNTASTASIWCINYNSKTSELACGKSDGTIDVWDVERAQLSRTIAAHAASVTHCEWLTEGSTLLTTGDDSVVKVHDVRCIESVLKFGTRGERHSGGCTTATVVGIPDRIQAASRLVSCDGDGKNILWDMRSRMAVKIIRTDCAVKRAACSASTKEFALASGAMLGVYDARVGDLKVSLKHSSALTDVARDSNDSVWITASAKGVLTTWE